jgi:hypothetical protein
MLAETAYTLAFFDDKTQPTNVRLNDPELEGGCLF